MAAWRHRMPDGASAIDKSGGRFLAWLSMLRKEKLEAAPLGAAPEVNAVLQRLGLGVLDGDGVSAFAGRNNNWAGRTSNGSAVFVKRLDGDREESLLRFRRALDLQAALLSASG